MKIKRWYLIKLFLIGLFISLAIFVSAKELRYSGQIVYSTTFGLNTFDVLLPIENKPVQKAHYYSNIPSSDTLKPPITHTAKIMQLFGREIVNNDMPIWSKDYSKFFVTDSIYFTHVKSKNGKPIGEIPGMITDWSPDNRTLVGVEYKRDKSDLARIFTINFDGSKRKYISGFDKFDFNPKWSPDGRRIVFSCGFKNSERFAAIYVVNKNGEKLNKLYDEDRLTRDVQWFDNNTIIAVDCGERYEMNYDKSYSLIIINVDTKQVSDNPSLPEDYHIHLVYSNPQNRQILIRGEWSYYGGRRCNKIFLGTMVTHNQFNFTDLTPGKGADTDECYSPVWSPNNKYVAFMHTSERNNKTKYEVYIVDLSSNKIVTKIQTSEFTTEIFWIP